MPPLALDPARAIPANARIAASANALTLEWAREHLGADAARRALARCRERGFPDAEYAGGATWASFASHAALLDALAPEMGERRFFDVGRANAARVERVVPGAGLLLKLASPKRLVDSAPTLWRTYADFGRVRVTACDRRAGALAFEGVVAPAAFWDTMSGFFTGLLERAGARAPVLSRRDGADGCVLAGTWC